MTNENPEVRLATGAETPGAPPPPPPFPPAAPDSDAKPVKGYCRVCGTGLTDETIRRSMGTIYCAAHAPAGTATDNPYASSYAAAPETPVANPDVNPGLAFFLGLIPGVGAIYNAQYAKGLLHALVFAGIATLADSGTPLEGIFEVLVPAFLFYMAFEAYHTAKCRRAGQPVDEFSSIIPAHQRAAAFPAAPILLIALGVLFLLINFDLISLRYLARWWPVGLIALGGYLLYTRMAGGSGEDSNART
jgi:hypothetical protein